jgi:hypothetical protein
MTNTRVRARFGAPMGMARMNFGEKFRLTCGTNFRVSKGDKQRRSSSINRGRRLGQGARDRPKSEDFISVL